MKIVDYSAMLLFAASFVWTSPISGVRVAQQQQQSQQQQQKCTMDMLQGYMITSPVNFEAEPQEDLLPERGQFIDTTKTTILIGDQEGGDQNQTTMQVKFNNDTDISTEILQKSIFAISWMRTNQSQQAQRQKINPVRVQLVNQDGKLFNVTETLGVLSTGVQQQQGGQNLTSTPQVQVAQEQQGNQTAVTQPPVGGNQTSPGQEGAVVVFIGQEINPGVYAFLLSAEIRPQQQARQQQQGPVCQIMTMPFRVRPVSDLQQSET